MKQMAIGSFLEASSLISHMCLMLVHMCSVVLLQTSATPHPNIVGQISPVIGQTDSVDTEPSWLRNPALELEEVLSFGRFLEQTPAR